MDSYLFWDNRFNGIKQGWNTHDSNSTRPMQKNWVDIVNADIQESQVFFFFNDLKVLKNGFITYKI